MVKHAQNVRMLLPMNCLNVFDHFVKLTVEGLKNDRIFSTVKVRRATRGHKLMKWCNFRKSKRKKQKKVIPSIRGLQRKDSGQYKWPELRTKKILLPLAIIFITIN